jgi:Na+-transporting methylmalonyl-CoA/oxaloacetate decarboxylase gamma subunit
MSRLANSLRMMSKNKEQIYLYLSISIILLLLVTMLSYATVKTPVNLSVLADGILVLLLFPIIVFAGIVLLLLVVFSYYVGQFYNTVNSLLSNMQILTTKVNRLSKKYARTTSAQFHSFNRIVQIPVHAVGFLRKQFTKLF